MPSESPPVPWTGFVVFLFFALWLAAQVVCVIIADAAFSQPQPQLEAIEKGDNEHQIAQMVKHSKNSSVVLLVAFLSAVLIAPISEEFLFRMLFQGWFESKLTGLQVPWASSIAITAVSFCFAILHGGNSNSANPQLLVYVFGMLIVANLLIFLFGMIYLTRVWKVQISRYLLGTRRFFSPQFLPAAGYCLLALVLIYRLAAVLGAAYPETNTSPIPIFFFSLLLGTIYSKTQNLSYSILLHACLNGTSFMFVWLSTLSG